MEEKIHIREHIALTPFEPGDKPNLVLYLNDPVLYRNTLRIPSPYTDADAEQWLNTARENRALYGQTYNWAIRHTEHGVIGGIGAFIRTGVDGHLDEIGYWLGEPFRGQGIATDAVRVLCERLFETRPALVRIEAKVHSDNPASVRVLEKAGFEQEGYARKHTIKDGELIDVILMARVRD
ncbi:MAG: GNAT family N-acetyltransferase [Saprospiraceae bacterium]